MVGKPNQANLDSQLLCRNKRAATRRGPWYLTSSYNLTLEMKTEVLKLQSIWTQPPPLQVSETSNLKQRKITLDLESTRYNKNLNNSPVRATCFLKKSSHVGYLTSKNVMWKGNHVE